MRRRQFITLLGGAAAWPLAAKAQQPGSLPRIGVLVSASPPHPFADAFWRGLHALGYSEGKNIKVEFRYTDGRSDRARDFAATFVQSGVDVIVAHFTPAVRAAMAATRTIPIVMAPAGASHLFRAQDHRDFARLTHESEMPCHLRSVEGHGEEEAQRRNRAVDARRAHAGLRLMQLKTPKVLPVAVSGERPRKAVKVRTCRI